MLIRKNTKAFKTIHEIITACQNRPDREKLIRLYITRAGHALDERISVDSIQGDASLFYEMNYQAVLGNLESSNRQLNQSDDNPGIYFFRSASNKAWDETPFEFDLAVKKEFASLPDLPVVRKKKKSEKFVLPPPTTKAESKLTVGKKEKVTKSIVKKEVEKGPPQPNYKLKHKICFTDLDEIVVRKPQLTKKDVLDYYNKIADYILPYLKDRPLLIRMLSKNGRLVEYTSADAVADRTQLPAWLQMRKSAGGEESLLLCNDKEHLLFYAEAGAVEFAVGQARFRSLKMPDYITIKVESPRGEFDKAIAATSIAGEILHGLKLPSFIKTDGQSAFHLYIPLDAKSKFEISKSVAEYICKLIRLKAPDVVALMAHEDLSYGKVTLTYSDNDERTHTLAPYSLVLGESLTVASPLFWDDISAKFQLDNFGYEAIFNTLKQKGDPFKDLLKKKLNADDLLQRIERDYSFLF